MKKALKFLIAGIVLGVAAFVLVGRHTASRLPLYTMRQSPSVHRGCYHTTLSSTDAVYVSDYDEYALIPENRYPTQVVARYGIGGDVCVIPGQSPTAYLAVDVGSEMPAFEVFRNSAHPPFDWRAATYRKMQYATLYGPAANKVSTNATLLKDVLVSLTEGAPSTPPVLAAGNFTNVCGLLLFSDQLPGLIYSAGVYLDISGRVYLAENMCATQWVQASPLFKTWVTTPQLPGE